MHTIITDKFVFGGKCIAKINGKTVFIPYALPNEKLEIEITEEKRDFSNARIVKILEPSPYRTKPLCQLYEKCGGCNMMHIESLEQKNLRKEIFKDVFFQNVISLPEIEIISANDFGYRSRIQLNDGCFSARKSNNLVYVSDCPVADKNINEWLEKTSLENRPKGRCNVFGNSRLEEKLIVSKEEKNETKSNSKLKNARLKNIRQAKKIYSGTVISNENEANLNLLGKKISFDVRGFFQSNIDVLEKAIGKISENLEGSSALDIYAGCGTFSVFLSDIFKKVTLVEHNRDALVYAEKNLQGKNHVSIGLSGAKWIKSGTPEKYDAAIIDPPRQGCEKEVIDYLSSSGIKDIRYVSCNPSTQSRDVSYLLKAGYKIKKAYLLDFYPNTSHVESLLNLEKE